MNKKKWFVIRFLAPATLCLLVIFLYPMIRTVLMSFHKVGYVTDNMTKWEFTGLGNYIKLMNSPLFRQSLINILKIWLIGGAVILGLAMVYSVIITSGIRGKNFWRSMLYLPHIISSVALATMWLQYVFDNQYGLMKRLFEFLHLDAMANFQWTAPENLFLSMMISYGYAGIGFYMLIMAAGIDSISEDYYEASRIEGAGLIKQFFYITLPMLKDIIKRSIILYSAAAAGFFVYSTLFSFNMENATVTPMVYMYEVVFGSSIGTTATDLNVGAGAAAGVLIMVRVLIVNAVLSRIIPTESE